MEFGSNRSDSISIKRKTDTSNPDTDYQTAENDLAKQEAEKRRHDLLQGFKD